MSRAEHVHCSRCGKRVSGVDPELGLVVRAWVQCPECLAATSENQPHSDVTALVTLADNPDDELVPLARCVCGATFTRWQMPISIYPEHADAMPCCGRRLYFRNHVRVFEAS
jgi:hypothetical protein